MNIALCSVAVLVILALSLMSYRKRQSWIRTQLLEVIGSEPKTVYALYSEIKDRTGSDPVFGAIYAMLDRLEREGLIASEYKVDIDDIGVVRQQRFVWRIGT